jgi:signal recognition particle subunit SRP54
MLETLTGRLQEIIRNLGRHGHLTEADIDAALREVRMALLEADVHFSVAKEFLTRVRARALGAEVSRALNPAQQVVRIVNEELMVTLGEKEPWRLTGPKPRVILLAGLQGSGKTTTAAKLARKLRNDGERVMMVAADTRRPAAVQQLQILGEKVGVTVFAGASDPVAICREALELARKQGDSIVLIDTAGRLQLDEELMAELRHIAEATQPTERILVADAMTGQEAVRIATGFHQAIGLTGLILTKMDGDARGGAAISMRAVAGVPIRWLGMGEGLDALDEYDPERLAGRILGMGDMLGLIRKAEETFNREEAEQQVEKLGKGDFTLEDLVGQMKQIRKMGPMGQWLDMIPGASQANITSAQQEDAERDMKRYEAILLSMTKEERRNPEVLNGGRKRRIARGSGTEVQEINRLIKQFREAQKLFKTMSRGGGRGLERILGYNKRLGA